MSMTVREAIAALQQCHPDAEILFSIDFESEEGGLIAVEHEVLWRRERGDREHPGQVFLHNNKSHFFNQDGSPSEDSFIRT